MNYERAVEVNSAMLAVSYARMGLELNPGQPLPSLAGYSLAEMVEASCVLDAKDKEDAKTREPGEAYSITMRCDDRLVAALYTAANYDGQDEDSGNFEPLAEVDGKALILVKLAGKRCEECGDRIPPERAKTGTGLCGQCTLEAHVAEEIDQYEPQDALQALGMER